MAAIQHLQAENLHHYDAICPRCRRATPVSLDRLRVFTPGWQEGLQTLDADVAAKEKEMTAVAVAPAAPVKSAEDMPATPAKKHHHASKSAAGKPASAKSAKASATKPVKKAAVKPSAGKKTSVKPAVSTAKKATAKKTSKPAAKSKSK